MGAFYTFSPPFFFFELLVCLRWLIFILSVGVVFGWNDCVGFGDDAVRSLCLWCSDTR